MRCLLVFLLLLNSTPVFADLQDFADDTWKGAKKEKNQDRNKEKEYFVEEENDPSCLMNTSDEEEDNEDVNKDNGEVRHWDTENSGNYSGFDDDSDNEESYDQAGCFLPAFNNHYVPYFSRYPYSKNEKNFINNALGSDRSDQKYFSLNIENRYGHYFDEGNGVLFGASILTPLLGGYVDFEYIQDSNRDYLAFFEIGANFPLIMLNTFELDLLAGAVLTNGVLSLNGTKFGMHFQWFPFKPVCFEGKVDYQVFKNSGYIIEFYEYDLKIGWMMNRYELFLGIDYRFTDSSELNEIYGGQKLYL